MKWLVLPFLLVILSPITPSAAWFWFSLPLNNWQLAIVSILSICLFFNSKLKPQISLILLAFLVLKLTSLLVGNLPQFHTCLQLHLPDSKCTSFYTKSGISPDLPSIDFHGPTFPLYGFNQSEFNLVGDEALKRPYLPFTFHISPDITYSSRNDFYTNRLRIEPINGPNHILVAGYFINTLALVCLLLIIFLARPTLSWSFLPLLLVSFYGTLLPMDLLLPIYLIFAKTKNHWWLIALCGIIFAYQSATRFGCYRCQTILPGGSDSLTYESFARDIFLRQQFWVAGEPAVAFYYTPLYRYFLSLFHFIGGESLWSVRFFGNLIYLFTLSAIAQIFLKFFSRAVSLTSLLFLGLLNKLPQLGLYFVFQQYYSESIGLPLLIFSLYLLIISRHSNFRLLLGALLLSLSIGVRPNYLFAVLPLFLYVTFSATNKLIAAIIFVTGLLPPVIFIITRNFIVAGSWQYFNTSGASTLAIGLVDLFYHGQTVSAPESIYGQIVKQTFINPLSTLIPIWNNFRLMIGLPSFLPQHFNFLPVYQPIAHSIIYLPVWLLGVPGLISKLISRFNLKLICYSAVFALIFFSSLPFGVYFNGSAKYYLYILFLVPFAIEFLCAIISVHEKN